MTRLLFTLAAVVLGGGAATAGGPPPVYVVADKVTIEADKVTIHGSFIRRDARGYGKPVEGVVCLGLNEKKAAQCRDEWKHWQKAAGTGRAISVGMCGEGGALMTVQIHAPGEVIKAPDAVYTPGLHLGAVSKQEWEDEPPVKALLAFVKETKAARAGRR